jgi:hypothetical protein
MNHKCKVVFAAGLAVGLCLSAAGTLKAQVSLRFIISGSSLSQGNTNNSGTRVNAPVITPLTTGSLLRQLALDEKSAGLWNSRTFPVEARLLYVPGTGFQVVNGAGSPLLNASNIVSLTMAGSNSLNSMVDLGSGAFKQTNWQMVSLTYDATAVGGSTKYTVTGLAIVATKDTKPNGGGFYTETQSFTLEHGTGEGVDADGTNILLTGVTITASGGATSNNGEGSSGSGSGGLFSFTLHEADPPGLQN